MMEHITLLQHETSQIVHDSHFGSQEKNTKLNVVINYFPWNCKNLTTLHLFHARQISGFTLSMLDQFFIIVIPPMPYIACCYVHAYFNNNNNYNNKINNNNNNNYIYMYICIFQIMILYLPPPPLISLSLSFSDPVLTHFESGLS